MYFNLESLHVLDSVIRPTRGQAESSLEGQEAGGAAFGGLRDH